MSTLKLSALVKAWVLLWDDTAVQAGPVVAALERSALPASSALLLCRAPGVGHPPHWNKAKCSPVSWRVLCVLCNFPVESQTSWWATADEKSNKLCNWHVQLRVFVCADKFCWYKENPLDNFTVLLSLKLTAVLNSEEDSIKLSCSSRKPD